MQKDRDFITIKPVQNFHRTTRVFLYLMSTDDRCRQLLAYYHLLLTTRMIHQYIILHVTCGSFHAILYDIHFRISTRSRNIQSGYIATFVGN